MFNWFGDEVSRKAKKASNKAMYQVAEDLLTASNENVPHDEGTLERSGTVTQESLPDPDSTYSSAESGKNINYEVDWYGKPVFHVSYNTPYAVKLHESAAGEYSFRGAGKRKWLEQTAKAKKNRYEKWAAEEFRRWMK